MSSQGPLPSFPAGGDDVEAPEGGGYAHVAPSRCRVPPRLDRHPGRRRGARQGVRRAHRVQLDRTVAPPRGAPDAQPAIARRSACSPRGSPSSTPSCSSRRRGRPRSGCARARVHVARASDGGHVTLAHSALRAGIFMVEQVLFTPALDRRAARLPRGHAAGRCGTRAARRSTTSSRGPSSSTADQGPEWDCASRPRASRTSTAARAGVRYASWLRRFGGGRSTRCSS